MSRRRAAIGGSAAPAERAKRCRMAEASRFSRRFDRLRAAWKARAILLKAISFALIGVINTAIDYGVFNLVYYELLRPSPSAMQAMTRIAERVADLCHCGNVTNVTLIVANVFSWSVAVSGSYAMNSFVTFAEESGRQLRFRDYARFVVSGIAGLIANTTTLVIVAQFAPPWLAKAPAIGVSFIVNFTLSHFVVFRSPRQKAGDLREPGVSRAPPGA